MLENEPKFNPESQEPAPDEGENDEQKIAKEIVDSSSNRAKELGIESKVIEIEPHLKERLSSPERAAEIISLADKIARERFAGAEDSRERASNYARGLGVKSVREEFPEVEGWSDDDIEVLIFQLGKYGSWEIL